MKFLEVTKDGGPRSKVWAHWLIEIKGLFSIVLLRFENGSREAFHNHAFNCFSWVLKGKLREEFMYSTYSSLEHHASFKPFITKKSYYHKVASHGRTWVLSFRGPWSKTWKETNEDNIEQTFTHGRILLKETQL